MLGTDELTNKSVDSVVEKDELTTDQFNLCRSERQSY
jgi:hypothetical protein